MPASERPRQSPFKMISVIEALNTIVKEIELFFEQNSKITVSSRELHNYCNFVLSENIYATVPMPPFNASLKDGYAVISKDGDGLRSVICNPQLPGSVPDTVIEPGKCIRISTGAAVPSGADAIVQVEDTELIETDQKVINIIFIQIKTINQNCTFRMKNPLSKLMLYQLLIRIYVRLVQIFLLTLKFLY